MSHAKHRLWRSGIFESPYVRGQNLFIPFSNKPLYHLVPWISTSFKFVVAEPRNCGLDGSQKTEVHPLQFKINPVR